MPSTPFAAARALERTSDGAWTALLTPDWTQGRAVFGGLLAALGVDALLQAVPPGRALRSLMVEFVGPCEPGPVRVEARIVASGRALTHGEARLVQGDRTCVLLLGAFGAPRPSRLEVPAGAAPALASPDERPGMVPRPGVPVFTQHFDYRWGEHGLPFSGASRAGVGGWVRLHDDAPVGLAGVLALLDAWPAPVLPLLPGPAPASTVTWMVNLPRAAPADGWAPEGWWRYEAESGAVEAGYAEADARLWGPDGQLVATSRQLVAEFSGAVGSER